MNELSNPFRPGAGTRPPALIGREQLINTFGVTIRRALDGRPGKSLMPIGLRGVGKTVLLNRFCEIATDEGYQVGFMEAPESGDFAELLAIRLRKMLLALDHGPTKQAGQLVMKALRTLKSFTLQLPDGSTLRLDVDAAVGSADSGVLSEDLTDLLVAAGEAAAASQRGLLLAVDEVQYLSGTELSALITAIHRTTQLELPVVLVGAGLPQLPGQLGDAKSYAERLFDLPMIGSLSGPDARDVLTVPTAPLEVTFDDAALDHVVRVTHGYPYFLQEWGYSIWNHSHGSVITLADVESVTQDVISQLDGNFFAVRFDRLTPKEKEYLHAMARLGPGSHRSGDVANELGVHVRSVAPRRSALIAKGMIYSPSHGDTAFTVPLFDEFLRRTMG